MLQGV